MTICTGKILRNGICDTCYHLSQSSSGDCGRTIDWLVSLESPDYAGDSVPLINTEAEQPAQPVEKGETKEWIIQHLRMEVKLLESENQRLKEDHEKEKLKMAEEFVILTNKETERLKQEIAKLKKQLEPYSLR